MNDYGYVVLANSKTELVAKVIKLVTNSTWSHALITCQPQEGFEMGLEAAGSGVSELLFDKNYRLNSAQGYRVYKVKVEQAVKDKAIATILPDLQDQYGYLDLPWFMWRAINRWFGRDIKGQDNWASKHQICSQLVVKYITACGLGNLFQGYGVNSICPQDLQIIMDAHPEAFEVIEVKD